MLEFSVKGIRVCIHFSFFGVMALLFLLDNMAYGLWGLYACIIHELGHLFMMKLLNIKTDRIVFYGAGIKIVTSKEKLLSFNQDFLVLISGCVLNFAIFGLLYALSEQNESLRVFSAVNLVIGLFNVAPISPLDGGQIVELLIDRYSSIQNAESLKKVLRIILIGAVMLLLLFFLTIGRRSANFTLYVTLIYFFVSAIMK